MPSARSEDGQATVELVAVIPLIGIVLVLLWQASLAGAAVWLSGGAARAAARAQALGADPLDAARTALPSRFESGLKVRHDDDGEIELIVNVPAVVGDQTVASFTTRARFEAQ